MVRGFGQCEWVVGFLPYPFAVEWQAAGLSLAHPIDLIYINLFHAPFRVDQSLKQVS